VDSIWLEQQTAPRVLAGIFDHGFGGYDPTSDDPEEIPGEATVELAHLAEAEPRWSDG
jgi:hypothetical protein